MVAGSQGSRIEEKGDVVRHTSKSRVELTERPGQRLEVRGTAGIAEVQVIRDGGRAPEAASEAADQDEPHVVAAEDVEDP